MYLAILQPSFNSLNINEAQLFWCLEIILPCPLPKKLVDISSDYLLVFWYYWERSKVTQLPYVKVEREPGFAHTPIYISLRSSK